MNGRAPSDLVVQMRILIAEEAFLWELAEQVTGYGAGTPVVHGPWQVADCQQVLTRWLDCGLIDCVATAWATKVRSDEVARYEYNADWQTRATKDSQHLVLARDDAAALLSDPSTWRVDGAGAGVMLCQSRHADELPFGDWFDKLADLPDHLIYRHRRDGISDGQAQQTSTEPEQSVTARLWQSAMQQAAAAGDLHVLCPVNRDAYLAVDWEPAKGQPATGKSIEDVFFFVNPGRIGTGQPFPFGRHRFWCSGCGAQRYLVVMRKPD